MVILRKFIAYKESLGSIMKTIVITGSTRGIGLGLANAFLNEDCEVMVSGRTQDAVNMTVGKLREAYPEERIQGYPCDVTNFDQVVALWSAARESFGKVDIWINNAGITNTLNKFWVISPQEYFKVLETNLLGAVYGAKVSMQRMLEQGYGSIYNMEGMGSDGKLHLKGFLPYGLSKASLAYLTNAMVKESEGTGILIGAIRPGMVLTEMMRYPYKDHPEDWERAKKIIYIMAEQVDTVAPWIARRVLANHKSGTRIIWNTPTRMIGKLISMPFRKKDLVQ